MLCGREGLPILGHRPIRGDPFGRSVEYMRRGHVDLLWRGRRIDLFGPNIVRNLLVRSGPERRSFHCIFYFKNDVLRNCNRVLEVGMNLDSSKTKGIGRVAFRGPCMHKGGEETPIHPRRSEEHTSELQSLMRISYAVFCLKKKKHKTHL